MYVCMYVTLKVTKLAELHSDTVCLHQKQNYTAKTQEWGQIFSANCRGSIGDGYASN